MGYVAIITTLESRDHIQPHIINIRKYFFKSYNNFLRLYYIFSWFVTLFEIIINSVIY